MAKMAPLLAMLVWALLLLLPSYVLSLPLPSTDVRRSIPTAALARRQGPNKFSGNKDRFQTGVELLRFYVAGSSYPPSSTLFQNDQVRTAYGPLHMDRPESFDFGTTPKSDIIKLQLTNSYHSEHILEFQVVKNLIYSLTGDPKLSKGAVATWTPSATTRYRNPVDPATFAQDRRAVLAPFMKKAAAELGFHSYVCLWWAPPRLPYKQPAQNKLEVGGIKHLPPFDIVINSLPSETNFPNEFVLLHGDTNSLKNAVWSANINIRTVDKMTKYIKAGVEGSYDPTIAMKAFTAVKHTMHTWEYMTIPEIQSTYNKEVARIISTFDSIERQLAKLPVGPGSDYPYFKDGYQMLGLKDKSEDFFRNYAKRSFEKSMKFIKAWAPVIIATWSKDYRDIPLNTDQSLVPGTIKDWDLKQKGHSLAKLRDLFAAEIAAEAAEEDEEAKESAADGWDSQSGGEGAQKSDSEGSEGGAPPVVPGVPQTPGKPSTKPPKVPLAPQKPQGEAGRPGAVGELSPSKKTEGQSFPDGFPNRPKPDAGKGQGTDATGTTGQKTDTATDADGKKSGTGTDQSQDQGTGTTAGTGRPQRLTLNPKPVYAGAKASKDKEKDMRFKDLKHEQMNKLANALFEHLYPQGKDTWFQSMERKWQAGPYYGGGGGSGGGGGGGGSQMVLPIRPGPSQKVPPSGAGTTSQRQQGGSGSGSGRSATTSGQAAPAPATRTQPKGQTPTNTKAPAPKNDGKTQAGSGSGTQKGGSSSTTKGGKGGKKGGSS
ncbi:hypothetical protein MAPG_05716 [Magnaporthiopsis poae ATCC 64411]|uniref:Uncharacterized protein n=1 Tax=Magnaporthiopsis poae (strain ATCC 64411 / 73-15) TaxID=644358 RepID=A0A0C4E050_MAGP6|nr:hypothetical protein MAPG_05716 [Magnaporthiopsis poae ATCC 64411]